MKLASLFFLALPLVAHDANGRSSAPIESRRLKNPLASSEQRLYSAGGHFQRLCISCHGEDGKSQTKAADALPYKPTDLTGWPMQNMKDGEIFWIVSNGVTGRMPAFSSQLSEEERWEMVFQVRELRIRELYKERIQLGTYKWQLPPGFPYPNIPSNNLMTAEKVELGRYLFYDRRLSLNQTQSCATCHQQSKAFTDGRPRAVGSTGRLHPRGAMSLINVAYSPVLTWANPNMKKLEDQALAPLFGDHPVELGMEGKEDLLLSRLKAVARYKELFGAAFRGEPEPFALENLTKAIACFERTLLSGNSPYDEYRRGDDPEAITPSAKRGEALFFSERFECFHCHGGFHFTGTVDYLNKGTPEIEFHNTGLYTTYPADNKGLYEFTRAPEDEGKFKAPTLRNIALTAPYMHDGSVKTLEDALAHYSAGGRAADNPNKSEFVKPFAMTAGERDDLLSFLRSLTDTSVTTDPRWSDPWHSQPVSRKPDTPRHTLTGTVAAVYPDDLSLKVSTADEAKPREFVVLDRNEIAALRPGMKIAAGIRKRGNDYILEQIRKL